MNVNARVFSIVFLISISYSDFSAFGSNFALTESAAKKAKTSQISLDEDVFEIEDLDDINDINPNLLERYDRQNVIDLVMPQDLLALSESTSASENSVNNESIRRFPGARPDLLSPTIKGQAIPAAVSLFILSFITEKRDIESLSLVSHGFCNWVDDRTRLVLKFKDHGPDGRYLGKENPNWISLDKLETLLKFKRNLRSFNANGGFHKSNTDALINTLVLRCSVLTHLDLNDCKSISDHNLLSLSCIGKNITFLDLGGCFKITDYGLDIISKYFLKLTVLKFGYRKKEEDGCCCFDYITDNGLQSLASGLPDLTQLDLQGCFRITNNGLKAIAGKMSKLNEFDIRCHKGYAKGPIPFTATPLDDTRALIIAENWPSLTILDLSYDSDITNKGLLEISSRLPELNTLYMLECDSIGLVGISRTLRNFRKLTSLNLGREQGYYYEGGLDDDEELKKLAPTEMSELADALPNLRSLELDIYHAATDSGVKALAGKLPLLSKLVIHGYEGTSEGLFAILENHPKLTSLELRHVDSRREYDVKIEDRLSLGKITDAFLFANYEKLSRLALLDLSNWVIVCTDSIIEEIASEVERKALDVRAREIICRKFPNLSRPGPSIFMTNSVLIKIFFTLANKFPHHPKIASWNRSLIMLKLSNVEGKFL